MRIEARVRAWERARWRSSHAPAGARSDWTDAGAVSRQWTLLVLWTVAKQSVLARRQHGVQVYDLRAVNAVGRNQLIAIIAVLFIAAYASFPAFTYVRYRSAGEKYVSAVKWRTREIVPIKLRAFIGCRGGAKHGGAWGKSSRCPSYPDSGCVQSTLIIHHVRIQFAITWYETPADYCKDNSVVCLLY